ncbi:MAG: integrase family protein [Myxococcales bacterium]|nr:integrase family protein [Myxococcales bacterium]
MFVLSRRDHERLTRPAALRWRDWDVNKQWLGELLVARSYCAKLDETKGTKTDAVKHVPVHPTLAAILGEWKLSGSGEDDGATTGN